MIKKIKLFHNGTKHSCDTLCDLEKRLKAAHFEVVEDEPDLAVSVGGDGTFLSTLRQTKFNTKPLYVGINCGHLGFLQEIELDRMDLFIKKLKEKDYKIERLYLLETLVKTQKRTYRFLSLNEVVIRKSDLKVIHLDVHIDGNYLEKFSGDGVIISTPIGSTAYNLSAGGCVIYPSLNVLQITHLVSFNSKLYRSLQGSVVVPYKMTVTFIPHQEFSRDMMIVVDGRNKVIHGVEKVEVRMTGEYIKSLRFKDYNFWTRVKEKFLY